jgi:hypothetical protein
MATAAASLEREVKDGLIREMRLREAKEECQSDPKALINEIRFFDPSTEQWVEFKMYPPEGWKPPTIELPDGDWKFGTDGADDWYWQSLIIDWLHDPLLKKFLILKARQLGITLQACAYALWLMLFRPGAVCVAYSYTEDEAKKLAVAVWAMFRALPEIMTEHVDVVTPTRSEEPAEWIRLKHADGRISSFQALPATPKHGHGARVTFAIMDEVAYMDHARRIYTAINPATTRGRAKLLMISTAFGVSNPETGEGNYFHNLYATRREKKLAFRFLPWNLEPTRDQEWYDTEAIKLDEIERNQQYPLNENDAFMLSGALYFDREALGFYRQEVVPPEFTGQFVQTGRRRSKFMRLRDGIVDIFERPKQDAAYAIAVDSATGRGTDYTSADVIDLTNGAIVAQLHAKIEAKRAAFQLHWLGVYYNEAKIAVERQGGNGEAIIVALRDGDQNLPAYKNLYKHRTYTRAGAVRSEEYGYPMSSANRNQMLDFLRTLIRERVFPWFSVGTVDELGTFIHVETGVSPRAQDGCRDDRVMSLAGAAEMFRQYGHHPAKKRSWKKTKYQPHPSRQI